MFASTQNDPKPVSTLSFMDVKALYDAAYHEKAKAQVNMVRFKTLIDEAVQMDEAYRAQLLVTKPFQYKDVA